MNPEERAQRKAAREETERQRIREAGAKRMQEIRAERGPIPEQTLREVVRPALIEGAQRAHRTTRKGA